MDLGVGSFVLVNSIGSRQARNVSLSMNWKTAPKSTTPLLVLGFARLVYTLIVDYQVHVGEHGVHWNFFFTLAGVSILTSTVNFPLKYSGILGSVILVGYWGMYLIGVQLGYYLLFGNHSSGRLRSNNGTRYRLWLVFIFFWFLTLLSD